MSYPILFKTASARNVAAIAGIAIAGISIVGTDTDSESVYTAPSDLDLETLGNGTLSDAISCNVEEERNGKYELEMTYPINGIHFKDIGLNDLLLVKPNYTDDPQLFRIYRTTKPLNGICTVYAQHITYDLSGVILAAGISTSGLTATLAMMTDAVEDLGFEITATRTASGTFETDVPASVRSWFGGKKGSLIDVFGGEWHYDNFTCTLNTARGSNRGVTIRYGKNLTELTQNAEATNLYTGVQCYYKPSQGNIITGNIVATGISLDTPKYLVIDASSQFNNEIPTIAQLDAYAQTYIDANNLTNPLENITLDFVQLQGLSERVDLCDTVTIQYEKLGINATAKCIRCVWDVLQERYTECEFGTARNSIASTILGINQTVEEEIAEGLSALEVAIEEATLAITGNKGGYVVLHDSDDDGQPDELLIMDTPSIATATKVWRWNNSGLGYSSTGYNGTFGTAITADGQIVANYITTGTMTANRINGGILKLGGSSNGDGQLEVYNSSNSLVMSANNSGLYAIAGTIGGWTIDDNRIYSQKTMGDGKEGYVTINNAFYTASNTVPYNLVFGVRYDNDWKFYVRSNGHLTATDATISGNITATSGTIGGWTIGSTYLMATANGYTTGLQVPSVGTNALAIGSPSAAAWGDAPFKVTHTGALTATNATITGKVTASSGAIAGWTITSDQIQFDSKGYANQLVSGNIQGCLRSPTANFSGSQGCLVVQSCNGGNSWTQLACVYYDGTIKGSAFNTISDRNLKSDINDLDAEQSAEFIYNLKPVNYRLTVAPDTVRHGFIAQDVEEVVYDSEWGIVSEDENSTKNLGYMELIADLVATVQTQNERIKALEARIQALEER